MGCLEYREFGRMGTNLSAVRFFVGGVAWGRATAPISVFFVRLLGRNATEPMRHRGFFWLSSGGFPREKKWRVLMGSLRGRRRPPQQKLTVKGEAGRGRDAAVPQASSREGRADRHAGITVAVRTSGSAANRCSVITRRSSER
jgi:hypothetical protein